MSLMLVLHVSSGGGCWRAKKGFYQFSTQHNRVAMLAFELGHYCPHPGRRDHECLPELLDRLRAGRRPIDQGNNGGVATSTQDFMQAQLHRTELAASRIGVGHE